MGAAPRRLRSTMTRLRLGAIVLACCCAARGCSADQAPQPPAAAPQGRGQGGRGGRGGPPRVRTRKTVLAWADTRNGIAQHDSVSHALAVIERLGYESGAYDTFIRTDSNIVANEPKMTDRRAGERRAEPGERRRDLLPRPSRRAAGRAAEDRAGRVCAGSGKGFVAAHVALTAFDSWPEFGELLGARYDDHPWNTASGTVINEDPSFPATKHFPATFPLTDEFYQPKAFSRDKLRVLLRLDVSKMPPNPNMRRTDGDFPLAWAKMYGTGPRLLLVARPRRGDVGQPRRRADVLRSDQMVAAPHRRRRHAATTA